MQRSHRKRSVVGSLAWVAREASPDLSYRAKKLQSVCAKASLQDLALANKTVADAKEYSKQGIIYKELHTGDCEQSVPVNSTGGKLWHAGSSWRRNAFKSDGYRRKRTTWQEEVASILTTAGAALAADGLQESWRSLVERESHKDSWQKIVSRLSRPRSITSTYLALEEDQEELKV